MNKKFDKSMFSKIKDALDKAKGSSKYDNILKFPKGHTYVLRLLPTIEEGKDPLFHYRVHEFKSPLSGKFVSVLSLQTFGERDPISEYRWSKFKLWKDANPNADNKTYQGDIDQKEKWAINVEVLDYPPDPSLNGSVKILRFGPQIKKIIDAATEGERAEELGWAIFDPTAGHDLKIVAEEKGEFTTFESSFFTTKTKYPRSGDDVEKLYESLHDLTAIETVHTYNEIVDILNEHFPDSVNRKTSGSSKSVLQQKNDTLPVVEDEDDINDDIPLFHDSPSAEGFEDADASIDAILEGLNDD